MDDGVADDWRNTLDNALVRRRQARAASGYDNVLAAEVAQRLAQRLDCARITPVRVLDLGCGAGAAQMLLAQRYPAASYVGVDWLPVYLQQARQTHHRGRLRQWLQRKAPIHWCASDAAALPFADHSFDLVWSNFLWHWLPSPEQAFAEVKRVLSPGGVCFFSALGPDTLRELRTALGEAAAQRVHGFADLHDLGDAMLGAGLSDPVMEMEKIYLRYQRVEDLWRDLRQSGATNARRNRPRNIGGRLKLEHAARALLAQRAADGRFGMTFEILYGHGWRKAGGAADAVPLRFVPKN